MITTIVKPVGYCGGVTRAIEIARTVKRENPDKRINVFGMLVHNYDVVNKLEEEGIHTVYITDPIRQLNEFTKDDIVVFTSHGHPKAYSEILEAKGITYFDAVCVRVKSNLDRIANAPGEVIYIGYADHPETKAVLSLRDKKTIALYDVHSGMDATEIKTMNPLVINQTTLSITELNKIYSAIKFKYPDAIYSDEICSATRLRQQAIMNLDDDTDLIIVVGSPKSSNTDKLFKLAKTHYPNANVFKVDNIEQFLRYHLNLKHIKKAAIAGGASTPIEQVEKIERYLASQNG